MKFKNFAKYLEKLEDTSSRTDITVILTELYKDLDNSNIRYALYFIQGRLAPKFIDLEFNVSRKVIFSALEEVLEKKEINKIYKELGDVGLVSAEIIKKVSTEGIPKSQNSLFDEGENIEYMDKELSITQVFHKLKEIAEFEGKGSVDQKKEKDFRANFLHR